MWKCKWCKNQNRKDPKPNKEGKMVYHCEYCKPVEPKFCPVCGFSFAKVWIMKRTVNVGDEPISTRFKCPECGISIEDTNSNRCSDCQTMCSDIQALNIHRFGGCSATD